MRSPARNAPHTDTPDLADKVALPTNDAYNVALQRTSAIHKPRAALARIRNDKKVLEVNSILPAHTSREDR